MARDLARGSGRPERAPVGRPRLRPPETGARVAKGDGWDDGAETLGGGRGRGRMSPPSSARPGATPPRGPAAGADRPPAGLAAPFAALPPGHPRPRFPRAAAPRRRPRTLRRRASLLPRRAPETRNGARFRAPFGIMDSDGPAGPPAPITCCAGGR